jgi:hypothetical protein
LRCRSCATSVDDESAVTLSWRDVEDVARRGLDVEPRAVHRCEVRPLRQACFELLTASALHEFSHNGVSKGRLPFGGYRAEPRPFF